MMPRTTGPPRRPARAARAEAKADPGHAWQRYQPTRQCPWNLARAAHLWRRAGFGATWDELRQSVKDGPEKTVDRLLRPAGDVAEFDRSLDAYENAAASGAALRAWWLRRMTETPHPLREKLTLFWHDLFAADAARVKSPTLMRQHTQRLRAGAMGRFDALLSGVVGDAAVLLSLGARASRKSQPDLHLARQLLLRYTVGPRACSDKDVRETARALTGWFVLRQRRRYFDREHDSGPKTVLGKTGAWDVDDVVRITAGHPATARNIVRRLYRWLINEAETPDDALLAPLARSFAGDLDVGRLVGTMLRSNLFFSARAIGQRVKRPVEFAVGVVRALETTAPTTPLAESLAQLGENLYHPPTRDGWAGGRHWINPATMIGRSNLAAAMLAAAGPYGGKLDPAAVARRHGHTEAKSGGRFLANLLLGTVGAEAFESLWAPVPAGGKLPDRLRTFTHTVVTQPAFQLA